MGQKKVVTPACERHVPELKRDAVPDFLRVLWERHRAVLNAVRDRRDVVHAADARELLRDRRRLVEEATEREREVGGGRLEEVEGGEGDGHGCGALD